MVATSAQLRLRCQFWRVNLQRAFSIIWAAIVSFAFPSGGWAVDQRDQSHFLVRTWDSEDGLPAGPIKGTVHTRDGYLWIASGSGLVRFDGSRFVLFKTNNTPALGDDRISCLLADTKGDLWAGSMEGTLARRRAGTFVPVPVPPPLAGIPINKLAEDSTGSIWVATVGAGLARWQDGHWSLFTKHNGLPGTVVRQLIADRNEVWALVGEKLMRWRESHWSEVRGWESFGGSALVLAKSRDGGLWLATAYPQDTNGQGGQLLKFKDGHWSSPLAPYPWHLATMPPQVTALVEDFAGRIWLGTYDASLYLCESNRQWETFAADNQERQIIVNCLAEESGSLWVGFGRSDQLQQVRPRPVQTLHLPEVAGPSRVFSVSASRDGSVWVGTSDAGVLRYRDGHFDQFAAKQGLVDGRVGILLEDSQTNLWVGTWSGLFKRVQDRFERVTALPALQTRVHALCEGPPGTLWVGSEGGLVRLRNMQSALIGTSGASIVAIQADSNGKVWAGDTEGRLFRVDRGRLEECRIPGWPSDASIQTMHGDTNGALWISSPGYGLFRWKNGNLRHWSTRNGLPSDHIIAILADTRGNLWFSSDSGIFGSPMAQFNRRPGEQDMPLLFRRLSATDGLDTKMGSGAGSPVASRSPDGRLWFPNQYAVAVFDPATLGTGVSISAPLVEDVLADNLPLRRDAKGEFRVSSNLRRLDVRFTAPNLESPGRERLFFRLKGWQTDWIDAGSDRVAHYNHLPPGHYQFELMAGGQDSRWRAASEPMELDVMPQFWERRSAQALLLIFLAVTVGIAVRIVERWKARRRLEQLEARQTLEQERGRIARDLHDDLGSGLTEVLLMGKVVERAAVSLPEVHRRMGQMLNKVDQLTATIDEIVWTINPENDTLPSLVGYLSNFAQEFLEPVSIHCRLDIALNFPNMTLAATVRHSLFLAVKEALNNAVKHSGASEVWLRAACSPQEICLAVEDNGKGFNLDKSSGFGNGLRNLRQRLEAFGGRTELITAPGKGTVVRFVYPVDGSLTAVHSD